MKKHIPNMITLSRLAGTFVFLFLEALSPAFFAVYVWCGLSDVLDGFIARKAGLVSKLGSILDSIADLCFFTIMMIKIFPYLMMYFPVWVWVLIYTVTGIRFLCYLFIGIRRGYFVSRHTVFNKLTGLTMFFLPFAVKRSWLIPYSLFILAIAYIATAEEIRFILTDKRREKA